MICAILYPLLHEHAVTCVIVSVHFHWDGQTLSLMLMSTSCRLSNTCTTSVWPPPAAHIRGVALSCRVHRVHTTEEQTLELTDHHPYYYWSLADNGPWTIQRDTYTVVPFTPCMGYGTQLHNISPTLVITLLLHMSCANICTFKYLEHCCVLAPPPKLLPWSGGWC